MKHTAQKLLATLLCTVLLLSLLPLGAFAAELTGSCGENLTWTLDESTGTLTISGTGPMADYDSRATPWFDYYDQIQAIIVEEGVTTLGSNAFSYTDYYTDIAKVQLPSTLVSIGEDAFFFSRILAFEVDSNNPVYSTNDHGVLFNKDQTTLLVYPSIREGSYVIPDTVTEIADRAFEYSTKLDVVTIPEGITDLGNSVFYCCTGLREVHFPSTLETIGTEVFAWCQKLSRITLPTGLKHIGEAAFEHCIKLEQLHMPDTVETVGSFAFFDCDSLQEVTLSKNLKEIPVAMFVSCPSLTTIDLPEGITSIGASAFSDCTSLKELTVPQNVVQIGEYAFRNCPELVSITLPGAVAKWGVDMFIGSTSLKHVVYTGSEANAPDWQKYCILPSAHIHYDAKGTEAHWVTKGDNTYFYCELCEKAVIGTVPSTPFTDVSAGMYYYEPVVWAVEEGITTGTSATTFSPDKDCTRGQIVTFLWRAYGSPEPTNTTHSFTDIEANAYYYKAVLWAVENGITTGTSTTTFSPDKTCTRGQAVTFLWRAQGRPTPKTTENPFTDVSEADYFYAPVLWAAEENITTGTSATTFSPTKTCTRGQIVTFLYRTLS